MSLLTDIAAIALPGLVWAGIDRRLGPLPPAGTGELALRTLAFGFATHALLALGWAATGAPYPLTAPGPAFGATLAATALAVPLAGLWVFLANNRAPARAAHLLGLSRREGPGSLWLATLNADRPEVEYVHATDRRTGRLICGWVEGFAEDGPACELLLRDVLVWDEAGTWLGRAPHLYLARDRADLWLEFPHARTERLRLGARSGDVIRPIGRGGVDKAGRNARLTLLDRPPPPHPVPDEPPPDPLDELL